MGRSFHTVFRGGRASTSARARLSACLKASQNSLLVNARLARFNQAGTQAGGKKGEANSRDGVSGIIPAMAAGTSRRSATESPTKPARPDVTMASQPSAAASVSRIHAAVCLLVNATMALAVPRGPCCPQSANSSRMSPESGVAGIPSACAVPRVRASPSRTTSWPTLRRA